MWKFILMGVLALVLTAAVVAITLPFLGEKIGQKMALRNVAKVMVADLEKLAEDPSNCLSLNEVRAVNEGKPTLLAVAVDRNQKIVGNTDIFKNETYDLDKEVQELLGKEGVVVIDR